MLVSELGRFGDNLNTLKPNDLLDVIPVGSREGSIGIFWHIGNNKFIIFTSSVLDPDLACVEMGQDYDDEENPDDLQIDYNLFHKDVWQDIVIKHFPEFRDFKFDHFTRGRILYETQGQHFTIFGSKALLNKANVVDFLSKQFDLVNVPHQMDVRYYKDKQDVKTCSEHVDCECIYWG